MSYALALTPGGHLFVEPDAQAEPRLNESVAARMTEAFAASGAVGLELLAGELLREPVPASFAFWRRVAQHYFTVLCHNPGSEGPSQLPPPPESDFAQLVETAPPMKGLEFLTPAI